MQTPPLHLLIINLLSLLLSNGVFASERSASPLTIIPPLAGFKLDPDTGLKVWRLGGSAAEMRQKCPHPEGAEVITLLHAQHFYSRTSPANRDETHALSDAANAKPRRLLDDVKHSDLILDNPEQAWWVYGNWRGLFAVRLADGHSKRIWSVQDNGEAEDAPPSYNASGHVAHIAGKPGWVLLSRQQNGDLYLVDSSGKQAARYVGNSRHDPGEVSNYKREARAASSFAGRYLFFVSDYYAHAKRGYDPEPEPGTAYLNLIELDQEP